MAQGKSTTGAQDGRMAVSDERVIELVDARRQHSLRYNHSVFNKLQSYYDTYRGVWQGRTAQFRNNITIPFTFAMIQSDVARKVQTLFGQWPIVEFEGYAPGDVARARKNTILISAQLKDSHTFRKASDFFLQSDICGTGILRYGWKTTNRKTRFRSREQIAPGFEITVIREGDGNVFNGPTWEPVDRLDFWQQPGKVHIDDMGWVIHRYWTDWDDLMEDSSGPNPYYDREAVMRLKDYPLTGAAHKEWIARRNHYRNQYEYEARQNERFARPIEIWEMHGLVPEEFAIDGIRHRCIAIGNERVVLKNREGPMPSGEKPFKSYAPMPDPYGFDGVGKAEVAYGPQRTADRINNQKLDAIDLTIDPQWVMSSSTNINTQNLFTRAGRVILVDGSAAEDAIRPLSPDLRGLQAAYQEISSLFNMMQIGTGETEAVMGVPGSSRETARGFLGRQENALNRLGWEARLAEENMVEPLANAFRAMDRLWLTMPHEIKILGSMATINPITGLPLPPEDVEIDYDDLAPDYRARAVGASQMIGRGIRQQNFMTLLQVMSANPAMMQLVNWGNFARQAFELFDFKNVDELIVNQVPMVNQIAAQNGQSPESVAGAAATPMEQLDPNILGALSGGQAPSPLGGL